MFELGLRPNFNVADSPLNEQNRENSVAKLRHIALIVEDPNRQPSFSSRLSI